MPPAVLIASAIGRARVSRTGSALMACARPLRIGEGFFRQNLVQQSQFYPANADPAVQMARHRARAARPRDFGDDPLQSQAWRQIQRDRDVAVGQNPLADRGRQRINQTPFEARFGQKYFTLSIVDFIVYVGERDGHRLDRLTRETLAQIGAPVRVEAAVRGPQGRHRHVARGHQRHPGGIRSEARPACAAEREHDGVEGHGLFAVGRRETERMRGGASPASSSQPIHLWRM